MIKKVALILIILVNIHLQAQTIITDPGNIPKENSPFSRLGLGNIIAQNYGVTSSMGGINAAFRDFYNFNDQNPASLAYLRNTVFEAGIFYQKNSVSFNGSENNYNSGNLKYLALGIPTKSPINEAFEKKIRKYHWGMGFSIAPYSSVGYYIQTSNKIQGNDSINQVNFYIGNGSTYKLKWSNGVSYKNFAAGIGIGSIFGNTVNQKQIGFNNINNYYTTFFDQSHRISGIAFDFGVQYDMELSKKNVDKKTIDQHLVFGLFGNGTHNLTTERNELIRKVNYYFDNRTPDTIINYSETTGKATLPSTINFGMMYEKDNKLKLGFQYSYESWSQYLNEGKDATEKLKDASSFGIGLEYVRDPFSYNSNAKKIKYRVGFKTGKDPRSIANEQLSFYNISAGIGIPLKLPRQQVSSINLGIEYGKLGITNYNESYFKFNLGIILNDDSWFLKRKYD
jgi:hypothetical protein